MDGRLKEQHFKHCKQLKEYYPDYSDCQIPGEDVGGPPRSTTLLTFNGQAAGGGDVNQWKRVCPP